MWSSTREEDTMQAIQAFEAKNASQTVAYQNELLNRGDLGQIAFGLFRAQKRSTRAKTYRRSMRQESYAAKSEALKYLDAGLHQWAEDHGIEWGWRGDPSQTYHNQVLYVQLPGHGQCSFHSERAFSKQRFYGDWDSTRPVVETVLAYCDAVMELDPRELRDTDLMPFGKYVGQVIGDIDKGYFAWLRDWEGLSSWASMVPLVTRLADAAAR